MIRKITTIVTAVVVAVAALPALAAFAADGSANLTSAANLFADGSVKTFTIAVTNDEAASGGLFGVGQTAASRVNYIDVMAPTNVTGLDCGAAPAGWSCDDRNFPGAQEMVRLQANDTTAGGLAGGQSLTVTFSGTVAAPATMQRTDAFVVRTATDFDDFEVADGSLSQTVHGLELGSVIVLDDLGRTAAAVNDYRFTAGQQFDVSFDVTNRSQINLDVTSALAAAGLSAVLTSGVTTLAPQTFGTYTYRVSTSAVTAKQDIYSLVASATGTDGNVTGDAVRITPAGGTEIDIAEFAPGFVSDVTVELAADLFFDANARDTVTVGNGDQDTNTVPAEEVLIKVDIEKANYPQVVLDGLMADGSGSYLEITCSDVIVGCPTVTASLLEVNDNTDRVLPRANNNNDQTLRLTYSVDFSSFEAVAVGSLLDLDADFYFAGLDDNDYDFTDLASITDLVRIDALAPILRLTELTGDVLAGRVKDGDTVAVAGNVTHNGDLGDLSVTLSSNQAGSDSTSYSEVIVTNSNLGTGTANADGTITQSFSVDVDLPGEANNEDGEATFALGIGASAGLRLTGSVDDTAGNTGLVLPAFRSLDTDNDHPDLFPTGTFDIAGTQTVRAIGYYINDPAYGADPVVRVTWDAGLNTLTDIVGGGCANNMWSVAGANVTEVLFYDGSSCAGTATAGSTSAPAGANVNDRILVLDTEINPTAGFVNFSYLADGGDLALVYGIDATTDAVLNEAYQQDGIIVDGRTPNVPVINGVQRMDRFSYEDANTNYEAAGISTDDNGNTDPSDDFQLIHSNNNDLQIPVSNFAGGVDLLEIVEITDTVNFTTLDPNFDLADGNQATYSRVGNIRSTNDGDTVVGLTHTDIAYATCGDPCQTRSVRAFRFVREIPTATGFDYIPGPFLRTDFLYDTQRLQALGTTLEIGTSDDNDDIVRIGFGGTTGLGTNNANSIAAFYGSQTEWNARRTLGGGADDTQLATHQAQTVIQEVNDIKVEIDFAGLDVNTFHATDYFKFINSQQIEDLAGNTLAPYQRIFPNGGQTIYTF